MISTDRLRELVELNRFITSTLDYDDVLERVVEKTADFTGADACALLLLADDGLAHVVASRGLEASRTRVFATALDERINVALMRLLGFRHDDVFLGVPVIDHGHVRGLLAVYRRGPQPPVEADSEEHYLVTALADQAAIALEHAMRYRQVSEEKDRHLRRLEDANRRKDEFLAMLGHELRNPVAAIATAAEVMRLGQPADPVPVDVRDVVYRQVRHMSRLLDDLLDVSRITRGTIELRKSKLDLRDVAASALQTASQQVQARQQRLRWDLPEAPVWLLGDADRLVQVLSNLLTNASRYTPVGGSIGVAIEPWGQRVAVRVRDDGEGIAAEDMPFLFEPFTQSKRGLDRPGGGLGLGLTLVKRLVELHGGTVDAWSEGPGRGSVFTIELPLPAADQAPRVDAEASRPAPRPMATGRRILIVEDNRDFARSLAALLEGEGHQVDTATDGFRAIETMSRGAPDVVLLDIGLPEMDGFELARRIRGLPGRAPLLVAVSGYGDQESRRRARESGIDHYLVKPFWREGLCQLLAAG